MKHLLIISLFLISNNLQAWVNVEITNNVNGRKFGGKFPTQMEADAWKSKQISKNSWGKPDRWERKGEQPCPGLSRLQNEGTQEEFTECFYAQEYTIVESDITAAKDAEQAKQNACKAIENKLRSPVDLNLVEINEYLRCR